MHTCPNCFQNPLALLYSVAPVPVHSVMLVPTREEALSFPSGRIDLGLCRGCGFMSNWSFDESKMHYGPRCEETQGFSPTFQKFHRRLALDLIERCGVRNKRVIEIGCGKGEFLGLLCALGGNTGSGFDPAFVPGREPEEARGRVEFVQDFYSEKYVDVRADFLACKMTLEHIPDTLAFLRTVRRAVANNPEATIFFQLPNQTRVLQDTAFWDIYHEHCSYFTPRALRNVFRLAGFTVEDEWSVYDDQYIMLTARPGTPAEAPEPPTAQEIDLALGFAEETRRRVAYWKETLAEHARRGERVVIWGSGSKGVAFFSSLGAEAKTVEHAVDINPFREGFFMPGSGTRIVAPSFLREQPPALVIPMNSIYAPEIEAELARQGVRAPLLLIEAAAVPA